MAFLPLLPLHPLLQNYPKSQKHTLERGWIGGYEKRIWYHMTLEGIGRATKRWSFADLAFNETAWITWFGLICFFALPR
jgi:hypothetical protein